MRPNRSHRRACQQCVRVLGLAATAADFACRALDLSPLQHPQRGEIVSIAAVARRSVDRRPSVDEHHDRT